MTSPTADALHALADDYFDIACKAQPLGASVFGVPGYDDLLPDLSAQSEAATAAKFRDVVTRAEAFDPSSLSVADRVTRACLVNEARSRASELEDAHTELSMSGHASPIAALFQGLPKMSPDRVDGLMARLRGLPTYIAQVGERALAGARNGRGMHARGLHNTVEQLTAYLALPIDRDPFLQPAVGTTSYDEARRVVADEVRPSVHALVALLQGPVADGARSDDQPGLSYVPDGAAIYARALAAHTTTARTPEEIHRIGLDLCAELRDEYSRLGASVFGTSGFGDVTDRLRGDLGLRYGSSDEMLADARALLQRAEQVVPEWFGTFHRSACDVAAMSELEAPTAPMAYYMPPAGDGSRPGRHWLNTYAPQTRTRYEYETLAFHESVPGHHLQFAVSQELGEGVPAFRRFGYIAAFSEGWGLYTERLCDEMGLYSGDLARFGMVSFDSWRACRLVVDTGMHYYGWSRQQAIDFMWANSAATMENIVNEVDRYIAWPGQACGYMIGRLEINDLRALAQNKLGSRFDIKDFHDAVLLHGGVPLHVLRDEVTDWIGAA